MIDLSNIHYLIHGNHTQKRVFNMLHKEEIFAKLFSFDPILVGSIPLQIDVPGSDVDIICCYENKAAFAAYISSVFGSKKNFSINLSPKYDPSAVVANFELAGFTVEIFGQNIPSKEQLGYRHMLIEQRLLKEYGNSLKSAIVALKITGLKTEPAFCKCLGIEGNPYLEILKLEI